MVPEEAPATPAPAAAPSAAPEESPFEGFHSEAFDAGERIEEKAPKPAAGAPVAPAPAEKTGEEAPEPEEGAETPAGAAERKPQTVQERIDEVTRARRTAERRADALERELAALRAAPPAPEKPEAMKTPPPVDPNAPKEPNPDDFEYGEIDPRYVRAVARYETQLTIAEARTQQQEAARQEAAVAEQRTAREKFEEKVKIGAEKYPDFHEKVVLGADEGAWPLSAELGQMIVNSDVGEEIAYHLATNPAEAVRVFHTSPLEQARYFGRLETKFSAAGPAATGSTPKEDPPAKTPRAPAPIVPARGVGGQFQGTASSEDFAAFEAAAQGK